MPSDRSCVASNCRNEARWSDRTAAPIPVGTSGREGDGECRDGGMSVAVIMRRHDGVQMDVRCCSSSNTNRSLSSCRVMRSRHVVVEDVVLGVVVACGRWERGREGAVVVVIVVVVLVVVVAIGVVVGSSSSSSSK